MVSALWSGRFDSAPDPDLLAFGASFGFDRRLFDDDVAGSIAWAGALAAAGVLEPDAADRLQAALRQLQHDVHARPALLEGPHEDVHSFVEDRLVASLGDLGRRLHTGRSRNEQVSLDFRLYLRRRIPVLQSEVRALVAALLDRARDAAADTLPAYTHMRRAQPVLVAHYFLAHVAALRRDHARLEQARDEADAMPLGSGAIAGTNYPVDTHALARELGFTRVAANSLDAASDRDFVASFLNACALCSVHLSRLAEDLILFAGEEFGFFELADAACTGSSLMPQKKNPDPLELVRGKAGRVIGRATGFLATLKGLPSGYNKDLQEDKEAAFDVEDTALASLRACTRSVRGLRLDRARARQASEGLLLATEVADYLVERGVPFRTAHEICGGIVRSLVASGRDFRDLTIAEWREYDARFGPDITGRLSAASATASKRTPQSTAPGAVAAALTEAEDWLSRRSGT